MVAIQSFVTVALTAFSVAQGASLQKRATSGRATFYDVGMGNCGWQNSGSEYVVALNTAQYGSTSQVSSACGKMVTINYNGKTAQAKVVDSCPTCPYGALDLSKSLFSYLTNGNMGLGQMTINWGWGASSGSSDSGSSSNNNNSNKQSSNNDAKSSSSSKSTPSPTPKATSSSSSSAASSTSTATQTPAAAAPSGTANKTVTGLPVWWDVIGTAGCDVTVPEGADTAAISPSDLVANDADLNKYCGKWVSIVNPDNNKTTSAIVTTFLPGTEKNSITLSDAYVKVADMNGDAPSFVNEVKWGFLN